MSQRKDIKEKSLSDRIISEICNSTGLIKNKNEEFIKIARTSIRGLNLDDANKNNSRREFLQYIDDLKFNGKIKDKVLNSMVQAAYLLYCEDDSEKGIKGVRSILTTVDYLND